MAYYYDARILIKIAHMYYDDGATQAEIAKALGVSRPLISKYLTKARESGIVEIHIRDELAHPYASIEVALERRYSLREAIVISDSGESATKHSLGTAAGNYLVRVAKEQKIIGVSSGTTLLEVANQIPKSNFNSLTVVPLVGGLGNERVDLHANHIAMRMADQLGAHYRLLHAPVVVDSPQAKELFLRQSSINDVFQIGASADIAVVGIGGSPEHSTMVRMYMGDDLDTTLRRSDVVGDICYNFINRNGEPCITSWNCRVLAISLSNLRKIPLSIGVAGGSDKVPAIRAALKGKLINALVTDYTTAEELLKVETAAVNVNEE